MNDIFKEFNEINWRTYKSFAALSSFQGFWMETEQLVQAAADLEEKRVRPIKFPQDPEARNEVLMEIRVARTLHDEVVMPTFRFSAVVTLFAIFERELRRFADQLACERGTPVSYREFRGSILDQVSKYMEAFHGFKPSSIDSYYQICSLQKVRNCIVHCYGDPALSTDKHFFKNLDADKSGITAHDGIPLEISKLFIEASWHAVCDFFSALFDSVGWEINKKWAHMLGR